jgi:hypothetical protein
MVAFSKLPWIVALCIVVFTKTLGSAAPVPDSGAAGVSKSTPASGGGSMAPAGDDNVYVQVLIVYTLKMEGCLRHRHRHRQVPWNSSILLHRLPFLAFLLSLSDL